jgi:hypothetical protein
MLHRGRHRLARRIRIERQMTINPLLNGAQIFSNIAATPASFAMRGGLYGVTSRWHRGAAAQ